MEDVSRFGMPSCSPGHVRWSSRSVVAFACCVCPAASIGLPARRTTEYQEAIPLPVSKVSVNGSSGRSGRYRHPRSRFWPFEGAEEDDYPPDSNPDEDMSVGRWLSSGKTQPCPAFENPDFDALRQRETSGPVHAPPEAVTSEADSTYLFLLVPPYHGSTALLNFLATSPAASTLCAAGTWACEGTWLLMDEGLLDQENRWDEEKPEKWGEALSVFERYWDRRKRVKIEKSPPNLPKAARIYREFSRLGKRVRFIMMTTSPCYKVTKPKHREMLHDARLALPSRALLHIRYEELLRDPYAQAARILDFLPELRSLDPARGGLRKSDVGRRGTPVVPYVLTRGPFENEEQSILPDWVPFMREFGHKLE